jgi:fatty acid-binding protein DegV
MSFPDGDSKVVSKVRGDKAVIPAILKLMKEEMEPGSPYIVLQGNLEERNQEMVEAARQAAGYDSVQNVYIGGVIAINAGPDLTGIVYRKK